jgi:hypothetical protein
MEAVVIRGLDDYLASELFAAAIEDIRSDLVLHSLTRETPLTAGEILKRSKYHALDLGRFIDSAGLSDSMIRIISRHLYQEMSDQLHSTVNRMRLRVPSLAV